MKNEERKAFDEKLSAIVESLEPNSGEYTALKTQKFSTPATVGYYKVFSDDLKIFLKDRPGFVRRNLARLIGIKWVDDISLNPTVQIAKKKFY